MKAPAPLARARRLARDSADLGLLWWALVVIQPLVPRDHALAAPDLTPWATLALGLAALLRARPLGPGAHPALRPRRSTSEAVLRQLGLALVPGALLGLYQGGAQPGWGDLGLGLGLGVGAAVLLRLGQDHGRTAWVPEGVQSLRNTMLLLCYGTMAALAGAVGRWAPWPELGPALLLGLGFLTVSRAADRPVHLAQRAAAGRRDGQPWRPSRFSAVLALLGPSLSWGLALALSRALDGQPGFDLGFVVTLLVAVWAALLWPRPRVAAVCCLLHEVVPTGGSDPDPDSAALSFEAPPEGALRLDPLTVRRTLHIHPWLVPVEDARIGELDDPVRPLWASPPPPLASHTLGEAAFLPDPHSHEPQLREITVSLRGNRDTAAIRGGDVQTRRLVVLRPFPAPGEPRRGGGRTWRWERELPQGALQVVDAASTAITLRDGDILVLGSEGVARAFEVELGEPLTADALPSPARAPQLEDYEEGSP